MEDMVWSYSRINSFETCPYGWYLRYIKHLKEQPQFYASYGTFIHKLIEEYYRNTITKEEMPIKFLFGFKQEVLGDRPSDAIVESYIRHGLEYLESFQPFPYKMVDVEMKVEFDIDGIPMVGFIDYLGEEDGEFIVVDNKSRDLKPRSKRATPTENDKLIDKMLRQLYLYSTGIKEKYGKFPVKLCFNCFKANTFIEEPFKMEAYEEAVNWAKTHTEEIMNVNDFPPHVDYFTCKFLCGYANECCYFDGGRYMWKQRGKKKGGKSK